MSKSAPEPRRDVPRDARFAIVCARWNAEITDALLDGAIARLGAAGVGRDRLLAVRVPGAFELPVAASRLAKSGRFAAVICLGAVIKGDTDHDRYINQSVADALQGIGRETGVPTLFGVLTCDTRQQAVDRAGPGESNKGAEAASAAIEMATLLRTLADEGL